MNIALAIERMDPRRGGREMSVAQIAVELAARGHRVTILCHAGRWQQEGVEIRILGDAGTSLRKPVQLQRFVRDVAAAGEEYDILHATLPVPGANVYQPRGGTIPGQWTARLRRYSLPRSIAARLGDRFNRLRALRWRLERELVNDPRCRHLAVSKMIAEEYAYHYNLADRVRVVYNAVEPPAPSHLSNDEARSSLRQRLGWDADDVVFLTVATNFALKGVGEWLGHVARWRKQGGDAPVRLLLIGDRRAGVYRARAAALGLEDIAAVQGPADAEQIAQAYAASDAVALLSWYDPCSRVVLEAVRCGLPAVTTIFNGAADVLVKHGCGEVAHSPRHVEGVHASLDRLTDGRNRRRLADACANAQAELSIARHVDELETVYTEVSER
ncbi:MAG: glycosyltransferase family 4 protein [Phycisphaerae bacterium]